MDSICMQGSALGGATGGWLPEGSDSCPEWPPGRFRGAGRQRVWGGRARRHGRLWWDFVLEPVRSPFL